jgi:hypothetical protein
MRFSECLPGDIILFTGGALQGVVVAQRLTHPFKSTSYAHAAIVLPAAHQGVRIAHALPENEEEARQCGMARGIVVGHLQTYFRRSGYVRAKAFRVASRMDQAIEAAEIASRWTEDFHPVGTSRFAAWKAFQAAFRSCSYGDDARQRAREFHACRKQQGGPASLHDPENRRRRKVYCSMFVVACYQAALGGEGAFSDTLIQRFMALDAKFTLPCDLADYLKGNDRWRGPFVLED